MTKRPLTVALATASFLAYAVHARQPTGESPGKPIQIHADKMPLAGQTDPRFQSFQIGMSDLTGGQTWRSYDKKPEDGKPARPNATAADVSSLMEARQPLDFTSRRLRQLVAALGPFYIRFSGTTANSVYFQDNDEPRMSKAPDGYRVVLTRAAWKSALDFAKAVDAKVLTSFAVSAGVRDESGKWTPVMAAPWLAYTRAIGGEIYAAELFNEPNASGFGGGPKTYSVDQYARDFAAFRDFTQQVAPDIKLVGPGDAMLGVPVSMGGATPEQFMSASPAPKFDIISYHFYGALSERCAPANSPTGVSPDQALSEQWLARQDDPFQQRKALRDRYAPGAPIWITETGAAACGGPPWQPTFRDTFRFVDQEARLAKQGLAAIFTHALVSGNNGVIDEKTFQPRPHYWVAVLWRRLMGARVLDAGPLRAGLHVYAHCLRDTPGGVAVLAINLQSAPAVLDLSTSADLYALSATGLESDTLLLNGRPLNLTAADQLPSLLPTRLKARRVTLVPTSINFLAIPQARNPHCSRDTG